jgi:polyhydroxybutyrate depolymerase
MSKPVKTVITNGTDDRLNPFYGGEMSFIGFGTLGHVRSSENTAHYFRNLYKTGSEHSATISGSSRAFAQIDELKQMGVPVVALVTIYNGGHTIPQTYYRFPRLLGATFENDQVIEYIWDFLDAAGPSATAIRTGQKNESPQ